MKTRAEILRVDAHNARQKLFAQAMADMMAGDGARNRYAAILRDWRNAVSVIARHVAQANPSRERAGLIATMRIHRELLRRARTVLLPSLQADGILPPRADRPAPRVLH